MQTHIETSGGHNGDSTFRAACVLIVLTSCILVAPGRVRSEIKPGLLVLEFERKPSQTGNEGDVHPSELGTPVGNVTSVVSLDKWKYTADRSALFVNGGRPATSHSVIRRSYSSLLALVPWGPR